MKIILLRHGEPAIDGRLMVTPREYGDWLSAFNRASIKGPHLPNEELKQLVCQSDFVVCSHLARSIDSAWALGVEHPDIIDPLFREFELPTLQWPWPKLPASSWTVLFRVMWLVGFAANAESFRDARQRAVLCLERLIEHAGQNATVLFLGHGYLLRHLTKLLIARGWQGPKAAPRKHWAFAVYSHRGD